MNAAERSEQADQTKSSELVSSVEHISPDTLDLVARDLKMDPLYVEKVRREIQANKLIFIAAKNDAAYIASVGLCIGEADEDYFRTHLPGYAIVYSLIVNESNRRQGVATNLMDVVESEARHVGKAGVALGVVPDNESARRLYEKRGYTYVEPDEVANVESHWDITDESGLPQHVAVDLIPMAKEL